MRKLIAYARESYWELHNKVSWPTWAELQNSSVVVLVASVIIALILLAMDVSSKSVLELYY